MEFLGAICISQNTGNESLIAPTPETTTIKLSKYGKERWSVGLMM
jgi:hypothetical protein